jgi:hypothetical protein
VELFAFPSTRNWLSGGRGKPTRCPARKTLDLHDPLIEKAPISLKETGRGPSLAGLRAGSL